MSDSCHVNLKNVVCGYGEQIVLQDLSFSVARGEVACLLGPSGCGKTTALRAIAGFEPVAKSGCKTNCCLLLEQAYRRSNASWAWYFRTSPCFRT
jgi:ABC-type nitrate/sulfonate/bicarbonate transport system ATPase subunit